MFYISYYTTPDDARKSSPAANAKTLSVAKSLASNGIDVEILSTCTVASKGKFIKGRRFKVDDGIVCRQFSLFNTGFGPFRRLQYILANMRLFLVLLFKAKKGENVLFYHAIERIQPILLAKKLKKFRLVLEVEEIYNDSLSITAKNAADELKCFACADSYIFPTALLNEKINPTGKPFAVIHGTYEVEPVVATPDNDHIHIAYAGTLSPLKGCAEAIDAAEFLNEKYHLHILGYGTPDQIEETKSHIEKIKEKTTCKITFEGLLSGKEYIAFLQGCHIGLSPQNPDAKFTDTSFPSKILSYMSNGLQVVSIEIPAIKTSDVGEYIHYFNEQTPQNIAQAIKSVDLKNVVDTREIISTLNKKFKEKIKEIL